MNLAFAITLIGVPIVSKAAKTQTLKESKVTITGIGSENAHTVYIKNKVKGSKYAWKSTKTKVAKVRATQKGNGKITPKKKGTTTLNCIITLPNKKQKSLSCEVTVLVPATRGSINNKVFNSTEEDDTQVIYMGDTYDFNRTLEPKGSSDKTYWIVSSTKEVLTINKSGVVTPIQPGIATISMYVGKNKTEALKKSPFDSIRVKIEDHKVGVTSVSAIGDKQIQIKFGAVIEPSTVLSGNKLNSNISILPISTQTTSGTTTTAAELGDITASLSSDTLTINTTNAFRGTYEIRISSSVKTTTGKNIEEYTVKRDLTDNVKPVYLGSSVDESGMVAVLSFSEPINIDKLVVSDPKRLSTTSTLSYTTSTILTTKNNYKLSEDKKTLQIDLSGIYSGDHNQDISVKLYGIIDLAGNESDPYPIVATIHTDTSAKPQAVCNQIIRKGNSLVATFNRAIQTPGTVLVNNKQITGYVNSANNKEVVYPLTYSETILTGYQPVTIYGFSTYNAATSAAQVTFNGVNFSVTYEIPKIIKSELKSVSGKNQLVLTFDQSVTLAAPTGSFAVTTSVNGSVSAGIPFSYVATLNDKVITADLTGSVITGTIYNITIPANFIKDIYGNYNTATSITVTLGETTAPVLPGPNRVQISSADKKQIFVTFANQLDAITATNPSNYSISGLTIVSATLELNIANSPSIVRLTLASEAAEVPYQIRISNIKGYGGTYGAMETWTQMINLGGNQTLELVTDPYRKENKIIFSFTTSLDKSLTKVNYQISEVVGSITKTLTPKNIIVEGNTITIELSETLTANSIIKLTPRIDNAIIDSSGKVLLNKELFVK